MATRTASRQDSRRLFRAISDPARRRILDRLAEEGECPALDLGRGFRASQPALSRHLRVLREAGLVRVRRDGRQKIYRLDAAPLREVQDWIETYRRFWTDRLDALGQYLDESKPRTTKDRS